VIHELAHGLTCKKHGGNVLECGVVFILFTPVAYVDATGAWRLQSKWQRIFTSAAGMYAELFCAAVSALVWSYSPPGIVNHLAYNVVIMAGFSTIVVNGNPLMRFDAYYMLADWLEIPNLSVRGNEYLRYLGRRYLLGVPADRPSGSSSRVVLLYGAFAMSWRLLVLVGILIVAHTLFLGAGIVVAIMGGLLWFGLPALRLGKYLLVGNALEKPRFARVAAAGIGAGALAWLLLVVVPWPGTVRAPAVVQARPRSILRGEVSGFVSEIFVKNGQAVEAGQPLLRLINEELTTDLQDLELEIQETKLLRDQMRQGQEMAAAQIQTEYLTALHTRLAEKERELAGLTVVAPIRGRVLRRDLDSLLGMHVEPGTELLMIAGPTTELALSIGEDDFELFSRRVGKSVQVRLQGSGQIQMGTVELVRPNASHKLPALALGAVAGGPLPVQPTSTSENQSGQFERRVSYELVSPRFEGIAHLRRRSGVPSGMGQVASVWFHSHHETVGQHVYRGMSRWIHNRIQAANDRG
jgi:putative peptide zinc metalloprotease protein